MRVLVLGVTGMLGNAVYKFFCQQQAYDCWGTLRSQMALSYFSSSARQQLIANVDVLNQDELSLVFEKVKPEIVINCIGLIKQLAAAEDPLAVLPINALFPHRLARLCAISKARLIHISTDCVFSGRKGAYVESDESDATDLYGKSKFIGEISQQTHAVTLRTSIIGHELNSNYALVDWFLSQNDQVKGFVKAIYTGLPTVELARVIHDYVIPNKALHGLYHVASAAINKFDLLHLIADVYGKNIIIEPDDKVNIDRSLIGMRFQEQTGYIAPDWPTLIKKMHQAGASSNV